jgi:hypothetical protein
VVGGVEVLGGVLVFLGIAATDMSADQTETQMDPSVSDPQALLAAVRRPWGNVADLIQMRTRDTHRVSFPTGDRSSCRPDRKPGLDVDAALIEISTVAVQNSWLPVKLESRLHPGLTSGVHL